MIKVKTTSSTYLIDEGSKKFQRDPGDGASSLSSDGRWQSYESLNMGGLGEPIQMLWVNPEVNRPQLRVTTPVVSIEEI